MRILMTTDTVGGVWTFTKELAAEFLKRGHEVALVSFGRSPSAEQAMWCERARSCHHNSFFFTFSEAPLEWMQNNEHAYAKPACLLQRMAEEFRADLLLSSQYCFGALELSIPKIVVAHSDVLSWAYACHGAAPAASKWLDQYVELVSRGLASADAVIAPTNWMLGALSVNFDLPSNCEVILNGRTLEDMGPSTKRKLQGITAGRVWDEAKNLQLLQEVRTSMPIIIAGEIATGPVIFTGNIGSATLIGAQTEENLILLMRESAFYVCTSIYEPFGLAPLEGGLCGCAVVANDIPTLREVWGNAATYFQNADGLSDVLQQFESCPNVLENAQHRSFVRARELSASRMADNYLCFLSKVDAGNRSLTDAA